MTCLSTFYQENENTFRIILTTFFVIQAIMISILYYMLTYISILDMSATYMLRYNTKISGMLLGVINGLSYGA